jgi:hypothetical protein
VVPLPPLLLPPGLLGWVMVKEVKAREEEVPP